MTVSNTLPIISPDTLDNVSYEDLQITPAEIEALRSVQRKCFQQSAKMGWHNKPREAGTCLALIHSEVSEALEGIRKGKNDDHLTQRLAVEVELGDALIRVFDLCGIMQLDVGAALAEKHVYNQKRADHKLENRAQKGGKAFKLPIRAEIVADDI